MIYSVYHKSRLLISYQDEKPDAAVIVLGDFNRCNLDKELSTFYQYVTCKTRLDVTLDLFYCSYKEAYKAYKLAP